MRSAMRRKEATLLCILGALVVASVFAQTISSSLVGSVVDPAGAVVPNAVVSLIDRDTGAVRSSPTDTSGVFHFLNLTPGNYSLGVSVTGFKRYNESNIVLAAQETRDIGKLAL